MTNIGAEGEPSTACTIVPELIPVMHLDIVDGNAKLVLGLVSYPLHLNTRTC